MEQNENIKDNNFENFEEHEKYKNVSLKIEKKESRLGQIALIINIICLVVWVFNDIIFEPILTAYIADIILLDKITTTLMWVDIGIEAIAVLICIWGLLIKRTVLLKRLIMIHVLFWISRVFYFLFLYVMVEMLFGWFK